LKRLASLVGAQLGEPSADHFDSGSRAHHLQELPDPLQSRQPLRMSLELQVVTDQVVEVLVEGLEVL